MSAGRSWVLAISLLSIACGSEVDAADAGGMDAGARDAATESDAATADAATESDAATADAATESDAATADAGIDCSVIGCGAPIFCGATCDAPCGCCPCGSETFCADDDLVTCNGGCYERTTCETACTESSSGAECATETCAELEAEYLAAVGRTGMMCTGGGTCHILDGHCGVGLGGCFYAVNTGVTQAQLDGIAARWTGLGCEAGAGVCDCAPTPTMVRCDAGGCLAR